MINYHPDNISLSNSLLCPSDILKAIKLLDELPIPMDDRHILDEYGNPITSKNDRELEIKDAVAVTLDKPVLEGGYPLSEMGLYT